MNIPISLDAIRRPEAPLKYRSCRKGRYAPPMHVIKLTATGEITPYKRVHPDEKR